MRYAFFGTPRFAGLILDKVIAAGGGPALVVANPDRPAGRKKVLTAPATKVIAEAHGIPVIQPAKPADVLPDLDSGNFDFFLVAAYAKLIPTSVLDLPKFKTLGLHPSLLPAYRGATPIQSVLLDGASETGVSLYRLDDRMDHGPVFAEERVTVSPDDDYEKLELKLAEIAANLFLKQIPRILSGARPEPQEEEQATFTRKFSTSDAEVPYSDLASARGGDNDAALRVLHRIKAFHPEPGAWTVENGKRLKLLDAKIEGSKLVLLRVQYEGKNPVDLVH